MKAKDIDWKGVRREADKRLSQLAKDFKKREKNDASEESLEFYNLLVYVVGQLRDSHAYVDAGKEINEAWLAKRPKRFDAGIELQLGTHGTVLVANTLAARNSNSPLHGKGVRHTATILETIDGKPAFEYLEARARAKYEDEGWQSTLRRAWSEAQNGLDIEEGEGLDLVFKTLDTPENIVQRYLETAVDQRTKTFAKLRWKSDKVSLRATECLDTRNPRNFRVMALEFPTLTPTSGEGVAHGRLPSGVGYVLYSAVNEKIRAALDEACAALADAPALVLDMRWNGGGGESGVGAFHVRDDVWKKPVAVLIGPRTMSAAETELWKLQQMRENKECVVRFFGQTTAGASGDKIRFELPSVFAKGRFVFRHWHDGRSMIEGNGIAPDELVLQDLVELSVGIDSCFARAEIWLAEL